MGASDAVADGLRERGCAVTVAGELPAAGDFDVVLLHDVLARAPDPRRTLTDAAARLAPGGAVVASVPNVAHGSVRLALLAGDFPGASDGAPSDDAPRHHFTRDSANRLLARAGLRAVTWRGVPVDPLEGLDDRFPPHLVEALRQDTDAMALHYVVRAVPTGAGEADAVAASRESPALRALGEMGEAWTKVSTLGPRVFAVITLLRRLLARFVPPESRRRRLVLGLFRRGHNVLRRAAPSPSPAQAPRGRTAGDGLDPEELRAELRAFLDDPGARLTLPRADEPLVSILVLTYNNAEHTLRCLSSIAASEGVPSETIVVDNASVDETVDLLERVDGVTFVRNDENLHFIRGNNQAATYARGRYLLFLNNDAYLQDGALRALVETAEGAPDVGAVGAKLVRATGRLQEGGSIVWRNGGAMGYGRDADPDAPEFRFTREVDYCSAACLLVRRDVFEAVGGFDTRYEPAYYEDADLCMAVWGEGYRVLYQPRARVVHNEYTSSDRDAAVELMRRNRPVFREKWEADLESRFDRDEAFEIHARDRRPGPSVLVFDDRVPAAKFGAGLPRMRALIRSLAAERFRITFVPMFNSELPQPDTRRLEAEGVEILDVPRTGMDVADVERILTERAGAYDVVFVSRPHNAAVVMPLVRRLAPSATLVYDAEALFYRREESRARLEGGDPDDAAIRRMRSVEHRLLRAADKILAVSDEEAGLMREGSGVDHVFVWGHPCETSPTERPFSGRADVLFVGTQAPDSPNEEGVLHFIRDVLPLARDEHPDLGLRVAGRSLSKKVASLASSHVRIEGLVEDLVPLYGDCRVFVNPVRFGAGIPLKLVEAMAHGIPSVTTRRGADGLGLRDGEQALVADDDEGFAEAVLRLYTDEELWTRIREGGLAWVEEHADPGRMTAELLRILRLPGRPQVEKRPTIRGRDAAAFSICRDRLQRRRVRRPL